MTRMLAASLICGFAALLTRTAAAESNWIVEQGHSTRDNSRAVSLKLLPALGTAGFMALCIQGKTQVSIVTLEPLLLAPNTAVLSVSYQIDGNLRQHRSFAVDAGGHSITIEGESAKEMLKEMLAGSRLHLRFEPLSGPLDVAEYAIAGLDAAIRPFREACNW